ncbi:MAG: hypothetical protein PHW04_00070 [Candidatus Wallbacteria bacterium]|nr:hypothetical protein [Candidatus Wallbacteria bacterium]
MPKEEKEKVNIFVKDMQKYLYGKPGDVLKIFGNFNPLFVKNIQTMFKEIKSEMQRFRTR